MSKFSEIKQTSTQPGRIAAQDAEQPTYTVDELNVILRTLSSASFPVRDIEVLYSAIGKLQAHREIIMKSQ